VRGSAKPSGPARGDLGKCGLQGVLVVVLAAVLLAGYAQRAAAVILPAVTIDGPSQEIVGFGGLAMAEDGTGGLVYLKRVDGIPHVFVSRAVAAADPGRHGQAVRGKLASHRRGRRRRARGRVGDAVRHEEPAACL
jgi:hypothetical protein